MMKIGIEHEFVFKDSSGTYLDFENSTYSLFEKVVDAFPIVAGDNNFFECKSLENVPKRCYVEGFERYDSNGNLTETLPKGLEIRTIPHSTIDAIIEDFTHSYRQMKTAAAAYGLSPLLTGYHPYKETIILKEPLNDTEKALRSDETLAIALNSMLLHGLQVSVSIGDQPKAQLIDLMEKLNYYLPYLIPFGLSSPFHHGKLFGGLSYKIYFRAMTRRLARIQKRKGVDVIEFGAFDACGDSRLMRAQLLLFKGLLLDNTLTGRAEKQNVEKIQHSALKGLDDPDIKEGVMTVINAAKAALYKEGEGLAYLDPMLASNDSYAVQIKKQYQKTGKIIESISNLYRY